MGNIINFPHNINSIPQRKTEPPNTFTDLHIQQILDGLRNNGEFRNENGLDDLGKYRAYKTLYATDIQLLINSLDYRDRMKVLVFKEELTVDEIISFYNSLDVNSIEGKKPTIKFLRNERPYMLRTVNEKTISRLEPNNTTRVVILDDIAYSLYLEYTKKYSLQN